MGKRSTRLHRPGRALVLGFDLGTEADTTRRVMTAARPSSPSRPPPPPLPSSFEVAAVVVIEPLRVPAGSMGEVRRLSGARMGDVADLAPVVYPVLVVVANAAARTGDGERLIEAAPQLVEEEVEEVEEEEECRATLLLIKPR